MGAIVSMFTGSSSSGTGVGSGGGTGGYGAQENQLLKQQEQLMFQNFQNQITESNIDNTNSTNNSIEQSHAQTSSSTQAGERQLADSNAHIIA